MYDGYHNVQRINSIRCSELHVTILIFVWICLKALNIITWVSPQESILSPIWICNHHKKRLCNPNCRGAYICVRLYFNSLENASSKTSLIRYRSNFFQLNFLFHQRYLLKEYRVLHNPALFWLHHHADRIHG